MPQTTGYTISPSPRSRSRSTRQPRQRDIDPSVQSQQPDRRVEVGRMREDIEPRTNNTGRSAPTECLTFSDWLQAEYRASVLATRSGPTSHNDYNLSEVARHLTESDGWSNTTHCNIETVAGNDINITIMDECTTLEPEEIYINIVPPEQQEVDTTPLSNNILNLFQCNLYSKCLGIDPYQLDLYLKESLFDNRYFDLSSLTLQLCEGKVCAITIHPRSEYYRSQRRDPLNKRTKVVLTTDLTKWAFSLNWSEGFEDYATDDSDSYAEAIFESDYSNTYHQYDLAVHIIPDYLLGNISIVTIPEEIECTACCTVVTKSTDKLNNNEYYECPKCNTIHIVNEGILYA